MNFKENKVTYNCENFSFKMFKDSIKSLQEQKTSKETTRYVGARQWEIEKLIGDEKPESKKRLRELYTEIDKEIQESHWKNSELFVEKYGRVLYAFCDNISKDNYFLSNKTGDYLWWEAVETGEINEDDYFMIVFDKGEFSYVKDIAGGYAGREILEKDIKKERVLELLKK